MTSYGIKIIAIVAMTIDHAANIIGQWGLFPELPSRISYLIINLMNSVGRCAFPIFAFMIVEGSQKTRNILRYIGRLALFALISEPFFYFSHWRNSPTVEGLLQNMLELNFGNVFFTLTLGTITIYAYQVIENKQLKCKRPFFAVICVVTALIGGYLGCDYGIAGILLIIFLFFAKTKKQKCFVLLVWIASVYGIGQAYNPIQSILLDCIFASVSCLLICLYNGKRGRQMKWTFYIYYPIHLAVLTIIHYIIASNG